MNILDANICKAKHDLIFIPFSTDGSMQRDFEEYFRENELTPFIPLKREIGNVYYLTFGSGSSERSDQHLLLACTNQANKSSYAYIRNIIIQSAEKLHDYDYIKTVGLPLLGAGGGGLQPEKVLALIRKTIAEFWPADVGVTYYHKDKDVVKSLRKAVQRLPERESINLAFDYSVADLMKAEWVKEFKKFNGFYYQLAKDKLNEFINYPSPEPGFFLSVYMSFTSPKKVYQDFLRTLTEESEEYKFLKLCGEVVAYMDRNAYNKIIWNENTDKRTVARSGVNQTNWITNLIAFKVDDNNFLTFTSNIYNAVNFLLFPESELCMLSENHRRAVVERIFKEPYQKDKFSQLIMGYFNVFSPLCAEEDNNSILITRLLYSPELRILWHESNNPRKPMNSRPENERLEITEPVVQSIEEIRKNNLKNLIHSDIHAEADLLNYEAYASVIAFYLTSKLTKPPLTIGIMAPWGKGKTSLMHFIERKINRKAVHQATDDHNEFKPVSLSNWNIWKNLGSLRKSITSVNKLSHPTIWFNAWKFQKNEQIWAGLAHEIITQLAAKLSLAEKEKFYLRLNLKRVDEDKVRQTLQLNALSKLIIPFTLGFLAILLTWITKLSGILGQLPLSYPLLWSGECIIAAGFGAFKIVKYFQRQPGADLAKYVQHPDYKKDMGYYANVEADLKHALQLLVDPGLPPVIFIDDLDRCSPGTISELIEAINLFISGDVSTCYFVIGQDAQIIAASLDSSYDKIGEKLGGVVSKRHGSIGWYFMEKFIQLQFNLPVITGAQSKKILQTLISNIDDQNLPDPESQQSAIIAYAKLESSIDTIDDLDLLFTPDRDELEEKIMLFNPERVAAFNDKVLSRAISGFVVEDSALENVVQAAAPYLNNSPRIMKRFANLYIFYQSMRYSNTCKGLREVSDEALTCWLLVMIRWPQLVRAIQWDNDKNFLTGNDPTERAEDFEQLIQRSNGFENYHEMITSRQIDSNSWLNNQELFEYFKDKNTDGSKLSHAVICGLW